MAYHSLVHYLSELELDFCSSLIFKYPFCAAISAVEYE